MLVLTRRIGEDVCIGEDIIITPLRIDGNKIRIGITAPDSVKVDRIEVREAKSEPPSKGAA